MMKWFFYLSLLTLVVSCESIKQLPSIPKTPRTVDRIPENEEIQIESKGIRTNGDSLEFDFQIRDSEGTLYQMKSIDEVIQKVEVLKDGEWQEIDKDEVKILPSSIKSCDPKDYCLFLDISGSMFKQKDVIFREAREFIDHKNDFDHIAIIKYASQPIIACDYTANNKELIRALNNGNHDTIKKGTKTPLAYEAFLNKLRNHPNDDLKVIIFSDLPGFFDDGELDSMFQIAYADSIETHRIIYRENVKRSGYFKRGKKMIMDTYDFPYGSSYIVENLGAIGRYLNNLIDEGCLTNTILLPVINKGDNDYRISLEIEGRQFTIEQSYENLDTVQVDGDVEFDLDTINILNIEFESGSDQLLSESLVEVGKVRSLMLRYPTIKIDIQGHTDNQGAFDYNKDLSQRRADTVRLKLIEMGVKGYRMTATGYGYEIPIASNNTAEGRQKNRRTEFIVVH